MGAFFALVLQNFRQLAVLETAVMYAYTTQHTTVFYSNQQAELGRGNFTETSNAFVVHCHENDWAAVPTKLTI